MQTHRPKILNRKWLSEILGGRNKKKNTSHSFSKEIVGIENVIVYSFKK